MVIVIGEILFDLFPASKRIGGAPFNFAFHMKKLGFPIRFISKVGDDDNGREILDFLAVHGFDLNDIQIDKKHPTGSVKVNMSSDGSHTFSIIKETAYDYINYEPVSHSLTHSEPAVIYFGTLIQRTQNSFEGLQNLLSQKPENTIVFCDINLRPGCYFKHTITASINAADILKLNTDELKELMPESGTKTSDKICVQKLMQTHKLKTLILTMGENGSQWFTKALVYNQTSEKNIEIADTVGAGDAYAAMSAAGILKGLEVQRISTLAGQFAAHVCAIQGALIHDPTIYQTFKLKLGENDEK